MSPPRKAKKVKEHEPEGITRITVKGFKSLANETSIEIRPLTILAGANSSGKSSIMQPLLLMKQTLDEPTDSGPLKLDGPNVEFSRASEMFSLGPGGAPAREIRAGFADGPQWSLANVWTRRDGGGLDVAETQYGMMDAIRALRLDLTHAQIAALVEPEQEAHRARAPAGGRELSWGVTRNRCVLQLALEQRGGAPLLVLDSPWGYTSVRPEQFAERLRRIIHLPGLRGKPRRAYPAKGVGRHFLGTFEDYTASALEVWEGERSEGVEAVRTGLRQLGLASSIRTRRLDDTQIEVLVSRLPTAASDEDLVNIADVGVGVSQALPVIVALHAAEPGRLVYIEQPEIHLHPRAQIALASLLADAAKRGVRVVAETHSSLLLLGVRTLIADEKLDPGLVKLHWFERGADGVTKVTSGEIDDTGAWEDWPEDFADVTLDAQATYLEAAEAKLLG